MCSLDESKESGNKYHTLSDLAKEAHVDYMPLIGVKTSYRRYE